MDGMEWNEWNGARRTRAVVFTLSTTVFLPSSCCEARTVTRTECYPLLFVPPMQLDTKRGLRHGKRSSVEKKPARALTLSPSSPGLRGTRSLQFLPTGTVVPAPTPVRKSSRCLVVIAGLPLLFPTPPLLPRSLGHSLLISYIAQEYRVTVREGEDQISLEEEKLIFVVEAERSLWDRR